MIHRPNLVKTHPWVKVDKETYQILQIGSFDFINQSKVEGHVMTLTIYNLICEERFDKETIEKIHEGNLEILPN